MTTPATRERRQLADLLEEVGPDAPTLLDWNARELTAHIVLRDRRPDAVPGSIIGKLAGYTESVQDKIASRDWDELVGQLRDGPPAWSPARLGRVDRLMNTVEFFVHHEDVRRARESWAARELDDELADDLYAVARQGAKLLVRDAPVGLVLEPDGDRDRIVANKGEPQVVARGPIGELVLWMYGRQDVAQVTLDGPDEAVEALRNAKFGI